MKWLLNRLGYFKIDYGFSCGRHWLEINGKLIAQCPKPDYWMDDQDVRKLAITIIPNCVWNKPVTPVKKG